MWTLAGAAWSTSLPVRPDLALSHAHIAVMGAQGLACLMLAELYFLPNSHRFHARLVCLKGLRERQLSPSVCPSSFMLLLQAMWPVTKNSTTHLLPVLPKSCGNQNFGALDLRHILLQGLSTLWSCGWGSTSALWAS